MYSTPESNLLRSHCLQTGYTGWEYSYMLYRRLSSCHVLKVVCSAEKVMQVSIRRLDSLSLRCSCTAHRHRGSSLPAITASFVAAGCKSECRLSSSFCHQREPVALHLATSAHIHPHPFYNSSLPVHLAVLQWSTCPSLSLTLYNTGRMRTN